MVDTHELLFKELSQNPTDWKWNRVHTNDYPQIPFSMSPLKFFYHREVPTSGNSNTVKVSHYSLVEYHQSHKFKAIASPNYKQIV